MNDSQEARSSAALEKVAKAEWDASLPLRNEFAGDYNTYLSYKRALASGRVRVQRKGVQHA